MITDFVGAKVGAEEGQRPCLKVKRQSWDQKAGRSTSKQMLSHGPSTRKDIKIDLGQATSSLPLSPNLPSALCPLPWQLASTAYLPKSRQTVGVRGHP